MTTVSKKRVLFSLFLVGGVILYFSIIQTRAFVRNEKISETLPAGNPLETTTISIREGDMMTSDGVQLHYWFYDRGSDVATIFLHGGPGGNTASFRLSQAESYADMFGSLLVFDQRGSGLSQTNKALQETVMFDRFTKDIDELREHIIPTKQVVIFGRSFGGRLAAEYAARTQKDVSAYILAAPGQFSGDANHIEEQRQILQQQVGEETLRREGAKSRAAAEASRSAFTARTGLDVDAYLRSQSNPQELDVGGLLREHDNYGTTEGYASLLSIKAPVLVVYGAYDTQVPPLAIMEMRPYLPHATFVELSGTHEAAYVYEKEFFDAIRTFLEGTK